MVCPNCGHREDPGARYCSECGTALVASEPDPVDTPTPTPTWTVPGAPATAQPSPMLAARPPRPSVVAAGSAWTVPGPTATHLPGAPVARWPAAPPGPDSRHWAIGAHLSALAGGFLGGVPAFLGPLIVWLVRKDGDLWAADHGRAALNFNLSVLLYALALVVLSVFTLGLGLLVALPAGSVLGLGWLCFSIVGAIKAANNELYHYPLTIPFVR